MASGEETIEQGGAHDIRKFRNALGWFATGVAVITTRVKGGEPFGITVNSFSSVSLDPPLVLWCLDKKSDTLAAFEQATHFTVNVLREEHQDLSARLARKGDHSLAGMDVREGESGSPALAEALAHFECEIEARHDAGDHVIMVGRVVKFDYVEEGRPLLYHRGAYQMLPPVI
ncbi:flavin reductase domain protein FMN-binding [Parvibaculum lavamentivorans DS-1]|uniref:Flavin reductase domain protein FMN-binding n=1 Tax=Parvibaculum lavamentivorans (strain DS-1 / DSM 13023 / NCIMB 13966) TaxID=402881 RepID=A7HX62_PARL1|nr:flavin reductase family protein [Parvibaculum lavamentivorans]ABS64495.1 flavin reductase domain protein FMN-binding [Parvibaculum lavamentivorans DS-1]